MPRVFVTMHLSMSLLVRYRLAAAIVLVAVAATAGFFLFARPEHGQPDQRIVKLAHVHHYSAAQVRSVFAARGISLRYTSTATPGMLWLSSALRLVARALTTSARRVRP